MLAFPCQSLIVSCQPVVGGPMDRTDIVVAFALAALAGGAAGLRIEGVERVAQVRLATRAPLVGIVKRDETGSDVRITPLTDDVRALAAAGADIIAFDATERKRSCLPARLCEAVHAAGKLAMADIAAADEARAAAAFGADLIGTTLSGYVDGPVPADPDLDLVSHCVSYGRPVIAEGRYRTPDQARQAIAAGAYAVVIGSAITRPEHITGWFAEAITGMGGERS